MPFPGHKNYGKMGPLNENEIPMRNKDIKKLKSKFRVGPSGQSYNPDRVRKMKKRKTTA